MQSVIQFALLWLAVTALQTQQPTFVETNLDAISPAIKATGSVRIDQEGQELTMVADVRMVKPGKYALSIHEKGECEGEGKKAGAQIKSGALGTVVASANGSGALERKLPGLTMSAINGKSVLLTAKDKVLACGVLLPPRF